MPKKKTLPYEVDVVTTTTIRPCINDAIEDVMRDLRHKEKRVVTRREVVERAFIEGLKRLRSNLDLPYDSKLKSMTSLAEAIRRKTVTWVEVDGPNPEAQK